MADRPTTLDTRITHRTRLGEMLRLYRMVRGLTLRGVAPDIGIAHATLMRIEKGQAFDADTLLKLWAWLLMADPEGAVAAEGPPAPAAASGSTGAQGEAPSHETP